MSERGAARISRRFFACFMAIDRGVPYLQLPKR
jgi:hypothetical protein